MKRDRNKKIASITYNYLKLPEVITFDDTKTITTEYDAEGTKLKKIVSGGETTDYEEDDIYVNGALYQTSHDEGRIVNGVYEYNINDHNNDLRIAFKDSAGIAVPTQSIFYDPWGEDLPTLSYLKPLWKQDNFRFTGKENLAETGYTDFGARFYDNVVPRFISIDGQAEKGRRWSPYCYALDSPLKFIDVDGNYPRPILKYNPATGNYNFTKSATHLLSLVSGVDKNIISGTVVQERKIGQLRPFYDSNEGGGAITVGTKDYKTITYTENFFADNKESYNGNGYGRNIKSWLSLSSHEVGHLPQIDKAGGVISYLTEFIGQYAKAGEHDSAPNEKEADKGSTNFGEFYNFVSSEYGKESIEQLFNNSKLSEETRIDRINLWWQKFEETKNKKDNEKK